MSLDNKNICTVSIFEEEYKISGNDSNEYILDLARIVNEKMYELSKNFSHLPKYKIAVLAALNLADDLKSLEKKYENESKAKDSNLNSNVTEKMQKLISTIDKNLVGDIY